MTPSVRIPYCGVPPTPGDASWNLDPILMAALLGLAGWHLMTRWRDMTALVRLTVFLGWSVTFLSFVSPLCNLSMALFSARVGQHVILTVVAAPMIAMGLSGWRSPSPARAIGTAMLFAALLWFWHMPAPYAWTLQNDVVYWSMHVSLSASAVLLWMMLLEAGSRHAPFSFVTGVVTGFQMSVLGAILLFAPVPLYDWHATTTVAWGLSPLGDQQLAGLIMWVPAGLIIVGYAVWALALMLSASPRTGYIAR